jgi:GTPase SAR1 family protein
VPSYFRDADAAIFVYDITNLRSFEEMQFWLGSLPKMHQSAAACSVLVANKCDRADRLVGTQQGEELAQSYQIPYRETSALTGAGLRETLELVVTRYISHWNISRKSSTPNVAMSPAADQRVSTPSRPPPQTPAPRDSGGCC